MFCEPAMCCTTSLPSPFGDRKNWGCRFHPQCSWPSNLSWPSSRWFGGRCKLVSHATKVISTHHLSRNSIEALLKCPINRRLLPFTLAVAISFANASGQRINEGANPSPTITSTLRTRCEWRAVQTMTNNFLRLPTQRSPEGFVKLLPAPGRR